MADEYVDLSSLLPSPTAGDTVPASWFEAVRDNFHLLFGMDGDEVDTSEGLSTSTYTDLTTAGPEVTVDTGSKALVIVNALAVPSADGVTCAMSHAVSGATAIAASDNWRAAVQFTSATNSATMVTSLKLHTALTAGSNTFTAKYRRAGSAGTATFLLRRLFVIPLAA